MYIYEDEIVLFQHIFEQTQDQLQMPVLPIPEPPEPGNDENDGHIGVYL
jgi:hypothetical protein